MFSRRELLKYIGVGSIIPGTVTTGLFANDLAKEPYGVHIGKNIVDGEAVNLNIGSGKLPYTEPIIHNTHSLGCNIIDGLNGFLITFRRSPEECVYLMTDEGNLTFKRSRDRTYELDRGMLDGVRLGDKQPLELSVDFSCSYVNGNLVEFLRNNSSVDIHVCKENEIWKFDGFMYETMEYDLINGNFSLTGKCCPGL